MGGVYKPHIESSSTHKGTFSMGDYNDPELFEIVELPVGSKPHYEIKVSTGTTPYTHKAQVTNSVLSETNTGNIYVGPKMDVGTWRNIATENSDVTITLTVYDDAGTTKLFTQTITATKKPKWQHL